MPRANRTSSAGPVRALLPRWVRNLALEVRNGPYLPMPPPTPVRREDEARLRAYLPDGMQPARRALERVAWSALLRKAEAEADELDASGHKYKAMMWRGQIVTAVANRATIINERRLAWQMATGAKEAEAQANWDEGERLLGMMGVARSDLNGVIHLD